VHAKGLIPAALPGWLQQLLKALPARLLGLFPADQPPNHVLINSYQPGCGIMVSNLLNSRFMPLAQMCFSVSASPPPTTTTREPPAPASSDMLLPAVLAHSLVCASNAAGLQLCARSSTVAVTAAYYHVRPEAVLSQTPVSRFVLLGPSPLSQPPLLSLRLCCAVLCCAVLCCAVLCHAILCHDAVLQPHEDGPLYHPVVLILSLGSLAVLRFWLKQETGQSVTLLTCSRAWCRLLASWLLASTGSNHWPTGYCWPHCVKLAYDAAVPLPC
jgi:hypothetical protein